MSVEPLYGLLYSFTRDWKTSLLKFVNVISAAALSFVSWVSTVSRAPVAEEALGVDGEDDDADGLTAQCSEISAYWNTQSHPAWSKRRYSSISPNRVGTPKTSPLELPIGDRISASVDSGGSQPHQPGLHNFTTTPVYGPQSQDDEPALGSSFLSKPIGLSVHDDLSLGGHVCSKCLPPHSMLVVKHSWLVPLWPHSTAASLSVKRR